MSVSFNANEVFLMAEQIEKNGAIFYRLAAEKYPTCKELFMELAEQEDIHEITFSEMRKAIEAESTALSSFDPDNMGPLYLKAFADGKIFDFSGNPEEILKDIHSIDDAIRFALSKEKDSIIFFSFLKDMVPMLKGKEKLDYIIKEELRHVIWLNNKWAEIINA